MCSLNTDSFNNNILHFKKINKKEEDSVCEENACQLVSLNNIVHVWYFFSTDLKKTIKETEAEIGKVQKEVDYWTSYKNAGQHEHATLIRTLQLEVEDMNTSFNEMKGR